MDRIDELLDDKVSEACDEATSALDAKTDADEARDNPSSGELVKAYLRGYVAALEDETTLETHGYLRSPMDGGMELIHMGDRMDCNHKNGFRDKRVIGISYHEGGKVCVQVDEELLRWHDPSLLTHHKEDTVEDLVRAAVELCVNTRDRGERHTVDELMQSGNIQDIIKRLEVKA